MQTAILAAATPALHIVYELTGPESGDPILLLHGFPYDVREYDEVRGLIASSDRRLIVPYFRGFGPTPVPLGRNHSFGPASCPWKERLAHSPPIEVPTIVLHGEFDAVDPPSTSEGPEAQFTSYYERKLLRNVGHCPPAEAPGAVSRAIEDVLHVSSSW